MKAESDPPELRAVITQMATARKLGSLNYVHVAHDQAELREKINLVFGGELSSLHTVGKYASSELINSLQSFISV